MCMTENILKNLSYVGQKVPGKKNKQKIFTICSEITGRTWSWHSINHRNKNFWRFNFFPSNPLFIFFFSPNIQNIHFHTTSALSSGSVYQAHGWFTSCNFFFQEWITFSMQSNHTRNTPCTDMSWDMVIFLFVADCDCGVLTFLNEPHPKGKQTRVRFEQMWKHTHTPGLVQPLLDTSCGNGWKMKAVIKPNLIRILNDNKSISQAEEK